MIALMGAALAKPAVAVPVLCKTTANNHMYIDSAYVSGCVDAGMGNINGNPLTDDFLIVNPVLDYTGIDGGAANQNTGTFSLNASLWDTWSAIALGFKFGTGRYADQWFVYDLNSLVSSGTWSFVNVGGTGGGLSHVQLYGVERAPAPVPEPATLALLSAGMFGIALLRRRKHS
jgi:hypothetical protein